MGGRHPAPAPEARCPQVRFAPRQRAGFVSCSNSHLSFLTPAVCACLPACWCQLSGHDLRAALPPLLPCLKHVLTVVCAPPPPKTHASAGGRAWAWPAPQPARW